MAAAVPYITMAVQVYGTIRESQAQAAVMEQNAAIARRDAVIQQQNATYNAQVLEMEAKQSEQIAAYNAAVLENEAIASEQQAQYEADKSRRDAARLRGEQTALYGFAGVQMTGTPLVIEADSEFMAEANEANLLHLGSVNAYKSRSQATLQTYQAGVEAGRYRSQADETIRQGTIASQALMSEAEISQFQAGETRTAGYVKAGTTILSGAGKLGDVKKKPPIKKE